MRLELDLFCNPLSWEHRSNCYNLKNWFRFHNFTTYCIQLLFSDFQIRVSHTLDIPNKNWTFVNSLYTLFNETFDWNLLKSYYNNFFFASKHYRIIALFFWKYKYQKNYIILMHHKWYSFFSSWQRAYCNLLILKFVKNYQECLNSNKI